MTKDPLPEVPSTVDLAEVNARVREESARFRACLPALLLSLHRDKWVVFRGGEVVCVHETGEEAYVAGLDRFGPYGSQVIAQVREPEVAVTGDVAEPGV